MAAQQVAAEGGRDVDGEPQFARPQALVDLLFAAHRRPLLEIAGAGEALHELPAFGALVAVEHGEGKVFDVEGYAVAEGDHQHDGAEEGEGEPDGIAQDLDQFAAGEGEDPAERGGEAG